MPPKKSSGGPSESKPLKSGKKGASEEEKNEEGDEEEPEPSCWENFTACIITICKTIYTIFAFVLNTIKSAFAFVWYPIKERCCICIERCDKKLNPYKDESYSNV